MSGPKNKSKDKDFKKEKKINQKKEKTFAEPDGSTSPDSVHPETGPNGHKPANQNYMPAVREIIAHLNEKTGTAFKPTTRAYIALIRARINDGYVVDDFKKVINNQCDEWLQNDQFSKFLRPQTLFGTKFDSYLNNSKTKVKNRLAY